jgi:hypothetical protein
MPYRTVKPYSDRGSLKDLKERQESGDDDKLPATNFELRVKELYEHAMVRKDDALIESLGLIAINGSPTDPVSIFRHREYVNTLSEKLAGQIEETKLELDACFADSTPTINSVPEEMRPTEYRQIRSRCAILEPESITKFAGADSTSSTRRSFRRVS